ncbi:uncharacterized protein LOC144630009 isoform X1 [Oculina patagonica]
MIRFMFTVLLLFIASSLLSDEVMGSSLRNKRDAFWQEPYDRCPPPLGAGTCVMECGPGLPECDRELGLICCSNGCGWTCQKPRGEGEWFP